MNAGLWTSAAGPMGWQDDSPYGALRDALVGDKPMLDELAAPPRVPPAHPPQAGGGGGPDPQPDMARDRPRFRAIFISDLHLGTPGCQAGPLLEFLREHNSESLYLVGDIIDGWQLRRRWYWPQLHNDVVQKLLRQARKGCRVVFVPGNHDEFARGFLGNNFGGIEVVEDAVHTTADGRRLWITHGDHFDGVIQCAKWLAYVGDHAYEFVLKLNRHVNSWRARMGLPYWSLSAYLKHKVKKAVNYVSDFESAVAAEARRRGHQGVVCGHIHHAEIREIDGTLYCNDGDWVESRSALVEHHDGRLELLYWQDGATTSVNPERTHTAVQA